MESLLVEYLQPGVPPCPPHLSAAQVSPSPVLVPTLSVPHTPVPGVAWTPPVVSHVLAPWGAAKAPRQPVRHGDRAASSRVLFLGNPLSGSGAPPKEEGGLWECAISGSWSEVAPSLHHPLPVMHHPPSFFPSSQSMLGLVVVALALVVALAPVVVAVLLALVTWDSCFPAVPTQPASSRCWQQLLCHGAVAAG